ncbi:MAG TPA: hypothetical protein VMF06_04205 [Candidatus Limnocylindria bacterium]|nr:hypothetical protein [Candidatus Limnocylindria bacterium]
MMTLAKKNVVGMTLALAVFGLFAQATVARAASDFEVVSQVSGPDPVTQPEAFVTDAAGYLWSAEAWNDTLGF